MKLFQHITVNRVLPPVVGVLTIHLFMRRLKGITTIIPILLCISQTLNAQLPSWQWGKRGGSPSSPTNSNQYETVIDMATDPNGNVYVLGRNSGKTLPDVDGHPGLSTHDQITVASWDCNGHFRWMKSYGGGGLCNATGIGTDSLGGVYISGYSISYSGTFGGPNYLDTDTILPFDNKPVYLIKYDTSGNLQWLRRPDPDNNPTGALNPLGFFHFSVSPEGDIYLLSYIYPGTFADGAFSITTKGYYVVRYDRHGQFQEVIPMDIHTSSNDGSDGIVNISQQGYFTRDNHSGRFYISGFYYSGNGTLEFGNTVIQSVNSGRPMYITAFSSDGTNLWVKQNNPDMTCGQEHAPAIDDQGNVYLSGTAEPGTVFNGYTVTNLSAPYSVPAVFALDDSGNLLWGSNAFSPNGGAPATDVVYLNHTVAAVGKYGEILKWDSLEATTTSPNPFLGYYYGFVSRFNAATGDIISLDSLVMNANPNTVSTVEKDSKGNLYLGGRFAYQVFAGEDTLTKVGGDYDWYVVKFGWENCNCEVPVPDFSATGGANFGMSFAYTGSTANSYEWDFGDGSSPGSGANPTHTYPQAGNYRVCVIASNSCGSNNTCRTITVGTTGIGEIPGFAEVLVYPNPATQTLTVSGASAGTHLGIYDALGRLMQQTVLKGGKDQIDVSRLASGIYLMRFTDKNGRRGNVKFVKE